MAKQTPNIVAKLLLHPATIFLGIGTGAYIGLFHKDLSSVLAKPGAIYLGLLQMCVLPLMISAVILGVGRLLRVSKTDRFIGHLILTFVIGMLVVSCLGLLGGVLGRPGHGLDKEQKALLGLEIVRMEESSHDALSTTEKKTIIDFVHDMVPQNVFKAITDGQSLPVLFFCVILGVALGKLKTDSVETALSVVDASYESLLSVISWLMYGLPFGLCCLFADQISHIGVGVLSALLKLIVLMYAASILLLSVYILIIWRHSGKSFVSTIVALKRALVVSFGTSSSFAALPFALEGLHRQLGFEKETTDLVIPLGITLNPHGNILCFGLMTVFMSQIYGSTFAISDMCALVPIVALAGVAASSAPGLASISMFALVLEPFGLPALVGIVLLTAINPIVDPILTAVNIVGNCAAVSLVAQNSNSRT